MDWLSGIESHWVWLTLGLLLAGLEMLVPGVYLIWLAVAALITGVLTAVFDVSLSLQVIDFVFLSLIIAFCILFILGGRSLFQPSFTVETYFKDSVAGLEVGAYFSFSGMVTFRNWKRTGCVSACPADRLLVETDAPYLAPVPHRGKRNEPAFVREVAQALAGARGEPYDALLRQTAANARRVFGAVVAAGAVTTPAAPTVEDRS